ncbi:carbohydrate-binding protein, partial [Corallococcus exiguus]|nr:carbohydrate-binding protein [Corallococcus exiguus]
EPTTSPDVAFAAEASLRALAGTDYVAVRVVNEEDVPVDVVVTTPYGSRTFADVRPGASAYQAFPTRRSQAPAGEVTVTVTRSTDAATTTRTVPFGR